MLDVIVLSPPGFTDCTMVRTARRAGCSGGVSLEFQSCFSIEHVLKTLEQFSGPFTLSIDRLTPDLRTLLQTAAPYGLERVILTDPDRLDDAELTVFTGCGVQVMAEVCSLAEARLAEQAGVQGLVVKGSESGGRIGEKTTFILLQQICPNVTLPVWARGGIGRHTAAACRVAGVRGVVLDWQLALTPESALPIRVKQKIMRMDGSETVVLGQELARPYRLFARPTDSAVRQLKQRLTDILQQDTDFPSKQQRWKQAVTAGVQDGSLLLVGQDGAFAAGLHAAYAGAGAICRTIAAAADSQVRIALKHQALRPESPLAQAHGTRYPIVQGPMTRVSDTADFALRVAQAGGLPFLGLGLSRGDRVGALLEETSRKLGGRPWGVGIIGFMDPQLLAEQLNQVYAHRPGYAIIAGGRPDQAEALKQHGIAAYLHVPSAELLRLYLKAGVRKVIFEGRECGGHIGPRTSFVLWEEMIRALLHYLDDSRNDPAELQVLFAGGIHDELSAAMVDALSAPLSERGVHVGCVLGTAYLFTEEAVASGAIVEGFLQQALACKHTAELETGVGHATRCAENEFVRRFAAEKQRLQQEQRSSEEIRATLEALNLGRMRVAAKGLTRAADGPDELTAVTPEDQQRDGMYMIGQLAALHDRPTTMKRLHKAACSGRRLLKQAARRGAPDKKVRTPADIAIIGMSCVFPRANDAGGYWRNIMNSVNAIREIPPERWDARLYFDEDRAARDKIYSRWGGFLDGFAFDPVQYGMPPSSVASVEPLQLMVLELTRRALADAGYDRRPFDRENTAVVFGAGGGVGDIGLSYGFRSMMPHYITEAGGTTVQASAMIDRLGHQLPEWTEDSFAGLLLNVIAGRVANRFDLGGANYTVDAACASSLAALRLAVTELETGASNMAVLGAADTMQSPFAYMCFSKTQALSPTGKCKTFDESADGIVIGEGIAVAVLKRLEDAERDGDHVYAVIKSVGSSSDGKDKALTAPRPVGQIRAIERAYRKAGFAPDTVGLIEAHGTGTVAGDQTEIESLTQVLTAAGAERQRCALGSVKSMIGHTKCAAGMASLLKTAMALKHRVLPPTIGVSVPNKKAGFAESPLYINAVPKPWIRRTDRTPRRAGVSAFGFGGTNFHAVLEEYAAGSGREASIRDWPAELFIWRSDTAGDLAQSVALPANALLQGSAPRLADLAAAVCSDAASADGTRCLALVAVSLDDLNKKLQAARSHLTTQPAAALSANGIYYNPDARQLNEQVAVLFSGQGSQQVGMLRDLTLAYPAIAEMFETADGCLAARLEKPLSEYIFPPPAFTPEEEATQARALTRSQVAQPALGAADMALYRLLQDLGIRAACIGGHSYGELVALCAAGVYAFEDLLTVSEARGRFIAEAAAHHAGAMAALTADKAAAQQTIDGIEGVWVANCNAPRQTVISGTADAVAGALERCRAAGIAGSRIPVACAFHSPLVEQAAGPLAALLEQIPFRSPLLPVYSNTTAAVYSDSPQQIRRQLIEHFQQPVRFVEQVQAMYAAGARIFIEVGPGNVITGLVKAICAKQEVTAVSLSPAGRNGVQGTCRALARLAAAGLRFNTAPLFAGRTDTRAAVAKLLADARPSKPSATTFIIKNGKAEPVSAALRPTFRPGRPAALSLPVEQPSQAAAPNQEPARPAAPARQSSAAVSNDARQAALQRHSKLMESFLETHRSVMLGYLNGGTVRPDAGTAAPAGSRTVAPVTAAPPEIGGTAPAAAPVQKRLAVDITESPVLNEERLAALLVEIVSERTGYPPDMLGLDMDLEADLGIDSIKRVEIISNLQNGDMAGFPAVNGSIEELSSQKNLRAIVAWILSHTGAGEAAGQQQSAPVTEHPASFAAASNTAPEVTRMLPEVVPAPLPEQTTSIAGPVLILDDGRGAGAQLCRGLARLGIDHCLIGPGLQNSETSRGIDPCDQEAFSGFVQDYRRRNGPIRTLVDLMPLAPIDDTDPGLWEPLIKRELHSLFLTCKALESDLRESGTLLAATRLGGGFQAAPADGVQAFWPGHGGVCGLVKSLAHEWEGSRCRVVDFGLQDTAEQIAESLMRELQAHDGLVEVGYVPGGRSTLCSVAAPLPADDSSLQLDQNATVLITGGACGITARIAVALAATAQCRLIIIGRSPLPAETESPQTAYLSDPRALKAALMETLGGNGKRPGLKEVEAAYRRLLREREMRSCLQQMRQAGSDVEYHSVDVTNQILFAALIADIYSRHGSIDGVIHGAGIIEDKLLKDKTLESFERVLAPKITGALTLAAHLRPDTLRFLAFMSSVSARYGNRGQCDYAAANEVLNKLAVWLNGRCAGRVLSVNWGPWKSDDGMVSAELAEYFSRAGVQMIPAASGSGLFLHELAGGGRQNAEVIWGGPLQPPVFQRRAAAAPPRVLFPLLGTAESRREPDGTVQLSLAIDPRTDCYLRDHQLDGTPVLPMAMVLELFAEVLAQNWPERMIARIYDFSILKGISFRQGTARRLIITAAPRQISDRLEIELGFAAAEQPRRLRYRAKAALQGALPPLELSRNMPADSGPLSLPLEEACRQWLFHGPLFTGITAVEAVGADGIVGNLQASQPARMFCRPVQGSWEIDPVVVDSALQLLILWARERLDMTPLPARFDRYHYHGPLSGAVTCCADIKHRPGSSTIRADIKLFDERGRAVGFLEGMEVTCSSALNRLGTTKISSAELQQ